MAQDRIGPNVRSRIEQYDNSADGRTPPIPTFSFVDHPVSEEVRHRIERHAGNIPVLKSR